MKKIQTISKRLAQVLFGVLVLGLLCFSIPFTGWRALSVQTGSMVPFIDPGALVAVHRVSDQQLSVGDVITYTSPKDSRQTITHRIVDKKLQQNGPTVYLVKGDANATPDDPVYPNQIVGRVETHVPHLGKALDLLRHPIGLALLIWLPSILIIWSETQLMLRRLLEREQEMLEQQKPALVMSAAQQLPEMKRAAVQIQKRLHLDGIYTVARIHQPKVTERHASRKINLAPKPVVAGLAIAAAIPLLIHATYASLNASTSITGNTIQIASASTPTPTPTATPTATPTPTVTPTPIPTLSDHIVFRQVVFRCSVDNTDTSASRPRIVLFNPTDQDIVANDWHLEDNSGRMITLPAKTKFDARKMYVIAPLLRTTGSYGLQYAGDHLTLYGNSNEIIDSLSWGTDTTQFESSLSGVKVGTRLQRVPARQDTNVATDFRVIDRTCRTPGQDDEFGTPAAPSVVDQFVIQEQTTITE